MLKRKWTIIKTPPRPMLLKKIIDMMYACIILHNMIIKDKRKAISPNFYLDEQHRDDDLVRTPEETLQVITYIYNETTHLILKADLVKHVGYRTNEH